MAAKKPAAGIRIIYCDEFLLFNVLPNKNSLAEAGRALLDAQAAEAALTRPVL